MNTESDIIQIESVSRRYGSRLALNQVSLSVPRGVVLGLVGANGAGKTTLIKHILGLLKPQSGSVRVLGVDPSTHPVEVLSALGHYLLMCINWEGRFSKKPLHRLMRFFMPA